MAAASLTKRARIESSGGGAAAEVLDVSFSFREVSRYFNITTELLEKWQDGNILNKYAVILGNFDEYHSFEAIDSAVALKATEVGKTKAVAYLRCIVKKHPRFASEPDVTEFHLLENLKNTPFDFCKRIFSVPNPLPANSAFRSSEIYII
jgi:hypothetical protein